jgi:putative hemolysin
LSLSPSKFLANYFDPARISSSKPSHPASAAWNKFARLPHWISVNLSALFDDVVGLPRPFGNVAASLFGWKEAECLYNSLLSGRKDEPLTKRLLRHLSVTYRLGESDLQQIPREGPVVIVANHPFGILEGAVLATVLARVRPDVRILANGILSTIPEIRDLLIPVETMTKTTPHGNVQPMRESIRFLQSGGCLIVFPAGEVSHFQWHKRAVTDSTWNSGTVRIIETLSRTGVSVSTVPIYISGSNSVIFQTLGLLHPKVRTILLARELVNKRNRLVELRIGGAIPSKKLLEISTPEEQMDYLRWRTYLLANRPGYKANILKPLHRASRSVRPIQAAVPMGLLATEIESLGKDACLARAGGLTVHLAPGHLIPKTLEEIGRLREVAFRAAGEGTGKPADLDRFDDHYLHLFAWKSSNNEIVGAYRLAGTDATRDLYTATLFKYGDAFLKRIGPALELGRSFVRLEYQKGFAPLLALWKGIGAYIARHPHYKILFGAVSISNRYQAISRELMVTFLEREASLKNWMGLISQRAQFRTRRAELPKAGVGLEDLSDVVSDLEPSREGIPVLLRQYLKLGGKLLGFNVDPEFSDALDGLILVDLTKTEPRLLERYLGRTEASQFLAYQRGTNEL